MANAYTSCPNCPLRVENIRLYNKLIQLESATIFEREFAFSPFYRETKQSTIVNKEELHNSQMSAPKEKLIEVIIDALQHRGMTKNEAEVYVRKLTSVEPK